VPANNIALLSLPDEIGLCTLDYEHELENLPIFPWVAIVRTDLSMTTVTD